MAEPLGDDYFNQDSDNSTFYSNYSSYENQSVSPTEGNHKDFYYFYETEQFTFLWIIFTLIVLGNSAVLLALLLSKSKKSRMNFFITHLAIADLSVGLISVLTDIIWKMTVTWYAGNWGCKIIRYLQALVTYSSTYVLVALSIDRYDAITHPMKFSGSWRRARILVTSAWVLSAFFSIPILIFYEERNIKGTLQCWIDLVEDWKWQVYLTLVSLALFIIPTLIISACYTIIVLTIWNKSKTLTPSTSVGAASIRNTSSRMKHEQLRKLHHNEGDVDSKRASSRGLIPKAKIKTVKMTFVIVFVFILCWSPYFIYDLLQVYGHIPKNQTQNAISTFIQSLAPLNSAANPIIYCLFSTHICRNLRKIAFFNWIAEKFCRCCPTLQQPLRQTTINRGSDYTTMSESLSRSSRRSSSSLMGHHNTKLSLTSHHSSILKKHVSVTDSNASAGSVFARVNSVEGNHNSVV